MKTRIIHTRVWKDNWFSSLSLKAKLLFQFLLTNENANMCGCYELNDKEIFLWLGFTEKDLSESKKELSGKVYFNNGWVKIINHVKYNNYGNGSKQEQALEKELLMIPKFMINQQKDTSMDTSMDTDGILALKHKTENIIPNTENKNSKNSLTACSEEEIIEISKQLKIKTSDAKNIHDDIVDKIADGTFQQKKYGKTVYFTLKSWIRRGIKRGEIKTLKSTKEQLEEMGYQVGDFPEIK